MIRIYIDAEPGNSEEHMQVTVSDPMVQIAAELGVAIADVYNGLKRRDILAAETFRDLMFATVHPLSPTWSTNTDLPGGVEITLLGNELRKGGK